MRKPVRHLKEDLFVFIGKTLIRLGFLKGYPRNPVFIVGSPRSGTSIFNKMIAECDDVANLSEAIFIWSPSDKNADCDHVKGAGDVTREDELRIRGGFGFYQLFRRKRIFVNKCPRSSVRLAFISRLFPEARYIHVYRDGRAVVASIINIIEREKFRQKVPLGAFCKPSNWRDYMDMGVVERHSHQWNDIMETIGEDSASLDRDKWIDVRYEDFCRNPRDTMKEIFGFIGVTPTEGQLQRIADMPQPNDMKWLEQFSQDEIDTMNRVMKPQLEAYGYNL